MTGQIDALIDLQAGVVEQMKNISVPITRKRNYNRIIEAHETQLQNQQDLNYGFKTGELVLVLGALDLMEMDDGMRQLLEGGCLLLFNQPHFLSAISISISGTFLDKILFSSL